MFSLKLKILKKSVIKLIEKKIRLIFDILQLIMKLIDFNLFLQILNAKISTLYTDIYLFIYLFGIALYNNIIYCNGFCSQITK